MAQLETIDAQTAAEGVRMFKAYVDPMPKRC